MFEDALMIRDREALVELFEDGAVLITGAGPPEARGSKEIARSATAMMESDSVYIAEPRQVVQARDVALVVGRQGINVVRRGSDGAWRYAITLLAVDNTTLGRSNDSAEQAG
jgi:ketosteroid isomerase-like protein